MARAARRTFEGGDALSIFDRNGIYRGGRDQDGGLRDASGVYGGRMDGGSFYDTNEIYQGRMDDGSIYSNDGSYLGRTTD